jgi:NAD(P)H-hydrate epimerase
MGAIACTATWWHAQAGLLAANDRTELGLDAETLCKTLIPTLAKTKLVK